MDKILKFFLLIIALYSTTFLSIFVKYKTYIKFYYSTYVLYPFTFNLLFFFIFNPSQPLLVFTLLWQTFYYKIRKIKYVLNQIFDERYV